MKITPLFAWYDFWVGIFIDTKQHRIYLLPIPMCGVVIHLTPEGMKTVLRIKVETGWAFHNLVAHPASQIVWFISLFGYFKTIGKFSAWIHDSTTPNE